ncbi:peptidase inhibitor I9 [Aquimarina sp. MAR_2010_214]|uniref:S8 family peptidase n=1 Tax=Aquimarina sp. MAR_2010_214 TaxID=1250026 RepID=UPI000C70A4D8|nr:S8 family serine peptidase [Aquimarina sp. MAR_2010_214]PKV50513.1 peptidase inhibitor I9 [Aquimarina sp. MAR_2010_214]
MKTQLRILSTLTVFSFLFFSCEKDVDEVTPIETGIDTTETVGADQAVPGEYIVIYKEDKSLYGKSGGVKAKSQQTLSKYAIQENNIKQTYSNAIQGFFVKNLSEKQVEMLKSDSEVAYVQPNYIRKLDVEMGEPVRELPATVHNKATTNDSWLPSGDFLPWGINRVGRADGSGKTCWIIDSGVAPHSDLNIDTNRSRSFVGGSWQDQNGHGTHVAGTVAAKNNGSGVIGVAYGATIVSVRVLNAQGSGSDAGILAGIDYVARNASNGDTWNYSVGYPYRQINNAVDNAFRNLEQTAYGAMAAGNSNDDTQYYSPQQLSTANSWCIGNMTRTDSPAYSSCYGSSVDRWAPGTNVWSTWINGGFNKISGTSMASPHVAGILLLRGNSTGTDGSVSKGGYTAPIATVN